MIIALAEGDRLWFDVCSATATKILVGDKEKQSALILDTVPLKKALPEYSPKELYTAIASFCVNSESPLWRGNVYTHYQKPMVWCGNFDAVYPVQAVLNVDPDYKEARILSNFATGRYRSMSLRNTETGELYNSETYPESMLKDIEVPTGVPTWAAYMKPYLELRKEDG